MIHITVWSRRIEHAILVDMYGYVENIRFGFESLLYPVPWLSLGGYFRL